MNFIFSLCMNIFNLISVLLVCTSILCISTPFSFAWCNHEEFFLNLLVRFASNKTFFNISFFTHNISLHFTKFLSSDQNRLIKRLFDLLWSHFLKNVVHIIGYTAYNIVVNHHKPRTYCLQCIRLCLSLHEPSSCYV